MPISVTCSLVGGQQLTEPGALLCPVSDAPREMGKGVGKNRNGPTYNLMHQYINEIQSQEPRPQFRKVKIVFAKTLRHPGGTLKGRGRQCG